MEKIVSLDSFSELTSPHCFDETLYPNLARYASFMTPPSRPVIDRESETRRLLVSLNRPELSNAFLVGDAGAGKTMLVQGTLVRDPNRHYVEVDLAKMAGSDKGEDGSTQMATRIKALFDDALKYKKNMDNLYEEAKAEGKPIEKPLELVMFIDEFHLLVQLSPAAAQAIKPILAESGRLGIKVIAATTFAEFHEYIEHDQALMQRLQRINVESPGRPAVIRILKSIANTHGVSHLIYNEQLYEDIYDYSMRYIPADAQPRKSILMLDAMIGWVRTYPGEYKMDHKLLGDVIYQSIGVRVNFQVDGLSVLDRLKRRVFAQDFAMVSLEQRLQICVADLHDKSRPIGSFLFTGPTGSGKTETAKALAEILFDDTSALIRFDMSEYSESSSISRFREALTDRVWNRSHAIVLIDEIEKAHKSITRLLLQVLDDGRLSNSKGRTVSFLNTYIILTTNAGNEVYDRIAYHATSETGADGLAKYQKVIRQSLLSNESFSPEIINRINTIVPFQPLSLSTYVQIMDRKLQEFQDNTYRAHGVELNIDLRVMAYLTQERFDLATDSGGARGLVALMDAEVIAPTARFINAHPDIKDVWITVTGKMRIDDKKILDSTARIQVGVVKK